MEIQFYGANCITIANKQVRLTIDDNMSDLGGKPVAKAGDVVIFTSVHGITPQEAKITIGQPGEYEVLGVFVYGISAQAHMDEKNVKNATMYKIVIDDIRFLVTGHIYPELTDTQLEAIGIIDVMFVPVGGNGYTLDPIGALKLIKKVEPKLVIPTHYDNPKLTFPVPQQPLESALKALSMEPKETLAKLKLQAANLPETTQLIVLDQD